MRSTDPSFRSPPAAPSLAGGVLANFLLSAVSPICLYAGIHIWQGGDIVGGGPILLLVLPQVLNTSIPILGLGKLRRWAIAWIWISLFIFSVIHPIALLICTADFLGWGMGGHSFGSRMAMLWIVFLLAVAPLIFFGIRFLHDPYWQFWRPDRDVARSPQA